MTRRAALNGQGTSLLSFAGVIQTILVALLIALATNSQAKALLQANPNIRVIEVLIGIGFGAYIVTLAMGILAFRETMWISAPQPLTVLDPKEWRKKNPESKDWEKDFDLYQSQNWRKELDEYNATTNPKEVPIVLYEMQLMRAIAYHQSTNNRKYNLLLAGFTTLFVGITLSAITGFLLLIGSV